MKVMEGTAYNSPCFCGNKRQYFAVLSVVKGIWGWYSLLYTGGKCYETKREKRI